MPHHTPPLRRLVRRTGLAALVAGTTALTVVSTPTALAAPDGSNVVISEVYGGGGNSGAAFAQDFVELYNPTGSAIDIEGWSVA